MAQVAIGIGTSHSPQLSIRAKDWSYLLKKDETDPRLDYQGLVRQAKPGLEAELTSEKFEQRDQACLNAIGHLGETLRAANVMCQRLPFRSAFHTPAFADGLASIGGALPADPDHRVAAPCRVVEFSRTGCRCENHAYRSLGRRARTRDLDRQGAARHYQ
jgi:hypothetical protein